MSDHHDHGDHPITLAEIEADLKANPIRIRYLVKRRWRRIKWRHDFTPPWDPPPLHPLTEPLRNQTP